MNLSQATRYACRFCGSEKFVPERPLNPTRKIRTGCDSWKCENSITPHYPVGGCSR